MEAAVRQTIRNAIDARARARRDILIAAGEAIICPQCGCDTDTTTRGCKACLNRVWNARRRKARPMTSRRP